MTIRGYFDGKYIVPDEPVDLPKHTPLRITIEVPAGRTAHKTVLQKLMEMAEQHPISEKPPDWSDQHNHYIHGTPKR